MSRIYSIFLLVASFLENLATTGYYYSPVKVYHGPSVFIVVFFCCSVFCLCRRLIDCFFNPGGFKNE